MAARAMEGLVCCVRNLLAPMAGGCSQAVRQVGHQIAVSNVPRDRVRNDRCGVANDEVERR